MVIHQDILSTIGDTPLVELKRESTSSARVAAKLEFFNPMGSVKDRPALAMIEAAESAGLLKPGDIIAEATSGNTGLGLAMVGAVKGYRVVLFVEEIDMLESVARAAVALNAQIINTASFPDAVAAAESLGRARPDVFVPHQFSNKANPQIHEVTTAQEIIQSVGAPLKAFVGSFGSGGTITGVGKALKSFNPNIDIVLVEPETVPLFSGGKVTCSEIHGVGPTFRPQIMQESVHDQIMQIGVEEAWKELRRLAADEGILCGPSSGALACAARKLARQYEPDDVIVTVFPDSGERYLGTEVFPAISPHQPQPLFNEEVHYEPTNQH